MRCEFHCAALAAVAVATVTTVGAAQVVNTNRQVTLIMQNGERHAGTLSYHNDANLNLLENGQDKAYSQSDIAVVDFGAGDPTASELNQLPSGTGSNDVDRHMVALRDGSVVKGRMYTITPTAITFNTASGHQNIDLNNVARWYVNPPAARHVYANVLNTSGAAESAASGARTGAAAQTLPAGAIGSVRVDANRSWTDSGINVRRGDRLAFSTTGTIAVRRNEAENIGPDGSPSEVRTGAPTAAIGIGGLIGRVGSGQPFAIGSTSGRILMPANGRLYLGVNDAGVTDNSGAFVVTIVR
jgi:hypothetical protein